MRAKLIEILKETPQNANQLAATLNVDYKTIRHHVELLERNHMITAAGDLEDMELHTSCRQH